jgi:hypothetical protein
MIHTSESSFESVGLPVSLFDASFVVECDMYRAETVVAARGDVAAVLSRGICRNML